MATARVYPAADQPVNINPQGQANPAGCLIENGQNVTFTNNSGSTISILFDQTAISKQTVFNDINNLAPGSNHTEAPLVRDRSEERRVGKECTWRMAANAAT